MPRRVSNHIRNNVVGYVALFFAISGGAAWAVHPGGANTISSGDIINGEVKSLDVGDGEVKNADLAADSVGSGKIADRQVKNVDLSIGASSSNTIADGGVQGIDVKNATLTGTNIAADSIEGADINESSLGQVPNADQLDGIDSSGFLRGSGQAVGGFRTVQENLQLDVIGPGDTGDSFSISYLCPQDSNTDGWVQFFNWENTTVKLFADNGSIGPSFIGDLGFQTERLEPAAASGEHITFQARYPDGRIVTVEAFSHHNPASDNCYAQAQAVVTKP
jgi:hypothetical protein